ncbi:MAG: hypothetical protein O8C67_10810 [Candidatus Methanoperedens sp.]|nr:hypothetical protein [Candidatus Methanoperedens sp.]
MSHISQIDLKIKSLEALRAACARLSLEFVQGQTTYKWYGRWLGDYPLPEGFKIEDLGKCKHAIRVPGADYEIGIVERNGEINLLWDFWYTGGLERVLGKGGGKLKQAYTIEQTKAVAHRAGYQVREKRTMMDRLRGALGMKQVEGVRLTLRRY